jgi:2,4-dienoyl-CoA reductase-like NADH-dependent reductase (Old Yellow Enzyme family)
LRVFIPHNGGDHTLALRVLFLAVTVSLLFTPYASRSVELRNRILVSPMCQYSAHDGVPNDWHLVHLASRAVGGAGAVITEAAAVTPNGRISPQDVGIWNEPQRAAWARIVAFIEAQGAVAGIQIAHAGRKASMQAPWHGSQRAEVEAGGWVPVGPGVQPFSDTYWQPNELTLSDLTRLIDAFADAARRSMLAGFRLIEIHAAHGYLLHQFLSPLVNQRRDAYGGSEGARFKFPLAVIAAVREAFPREFPVWLRVSATDWVDGGWDLESTIEFCRLAQAMGVDMVGCSSGGAIAGASIPTAPGYQVPFARRIRAEAKVPTYAVGLITEPQQAEAVLANGDADAVALARALLRDPYWPRHAAKTLGVPMEWPDPYKRCEV